MRRFLHFHGKRHPRELGGAEVTAFLSDLAVRGMSASTQNQTLSALLFLYQVVLGSRLPWMPRRASAVVIAGTHRDVSTTMIDTPVLNRGGRGVRSPLDEPDMVARPSAGGGASPGEGGGAGGRRQ